MTDLEQLKSAADTFRGTLLGDTLNRVCQDLDRLEQQNQELVRQVRDLQDLVVSK
jgi:hypothetical protein